MRNACKGIKQSIRNQDDFGYQVVLNFNRNGNSYTTAIGGVITMLIKLTLVAYCSQRIHKMVNNEINSYMTFTRLTKYDDSNDCVG